MIIVISIALVVLSMLSRVFCGRKLNFLNQNFEDILFEIYYLGMSGNEYDSGANSSESPTVSCSTSDGDTSISGSVRHVRWYNHAYDDEPLTEPGQNVEIATADADRILPATLEERSNGSIALSQW